MVIDFLLNLVDSWMQGLASLLPTWNTDTMQEAASMAIYTVHGYLNYFRDWGIPVDLLRNMLTAMIGMEVAYATVLIVVFIYNRVRGS